MEWIQLQRDSKLLRKVFLSFFHYRWGKMLRQKKRNLLFPILGLISFILFLTMYYHTHEEGDLLMLALAGYLMLYLPVGYIRQKLKFGKWMETHEKSSPPNYSFRYDENGFYYESSHFDSHMKWDIFSSYEVNKKTNCIYLYNASMNLQDIMIEEYMGKEHYEKILELVRSKLPERRD